MTENKGLRHQRGAIGLFGVLVLILVVVFAALTVDASRLWMTKRQLQSVTDIAAIEAAKGIGCNPTINSVVARAQSAAIANGYNGNVAAGDNSVVVGGITNPNGIRVFQPGSSIEAVRVVLTKRVPASLVAGGLFSNTVLLRAEATSLANNPIASFSAGTSTVSLNTNESVLLNRLFSEILGSQVNLDVAAYQGLANANIRLADLLATQLQVSTINDFLNMQFPTGELLTLLAAGAAQSQNANNNAVTALQALAAASQRNTGLALSDILVVNSLNPSELSTASVNLFSLVTSIITFSNGQTGINLPLTVNIPGLTNVGSTIRIIQAPQIAIGPPAGIGGAICTSARTAQIEVNVDAQVSIPLLARIDMRLATQVAPGQVDLRSISYNDSSTSVNFETYPGLVGTRLTNAAGTGPAVISSLLNVPIARLSLGLPSADTSPGNTVFDIENPTIAQLPKTASESVQLSSTFENLLRSEQSIAVEVLGINLPVIGQVVDSIVRPILVQASTSLIDPLLRILGVRVGIIDVKLDDVSIGNPRPLVI